MFKNREINLLGEKYRIQFVDKIVMEDNQDGFTWGITEYEKNLITIATKRSDGKPLSKDVINTTIMHELIHAILMSGQYKTCCGDEPLVEWLAKNIYKVIKSNIIQ